MPVLVCPIAGVNFNRGARAALAELPPGTPLTLIREADNKFDPLAVALWCGRQKLGYVPKSENMPVAWAVASKKRPRAELARDAQGQAAVRIAWDEPEEPG